MPLLKDSRGGNENAESYDIWDAGARNDVCLSRKIWRGRMDFPVIASRLTDVVRRDTRWFKHINYPYLAVEMILEGTVEYRSEEGCRRVERGGVYVIVPGGSVTMVNAAEQNRRKLTLLFCGECLWSLAVAFGFHSRPLRIPENPAAVEAEMRIVGELIGRPAPAEELALASYRLLLKLSRIDSGTSPAPPAVLDAKRYIAANFRRRLSVGEIAAAVHCSETTLRRLFAACCRRSPAVYVNRFRLEYAAGLLRNGGEQIKEVAHLCGFRDAAGFIASFKEVYGMTPLAFRKTGGGK